MTKKRESEFSGVKMEILFRKKRHSEILVREKFFRPAKLGARSPPLAHSDMHFSLINSVLVSGVISTKFLDICAIQFLTLYCIVSIHLYSAS